MLPPGEMKLSPLLGKHIVAVVHSQCAEATGPAEQLFLVFDDGTNYEFYGSAIGAAACGTVTAPP